jgi:hypothetical protein
VKGEIKIYRKQAPESIQEIFQPYIRIVVLCLLREKIWAASRSGKTFLGKKYRILSKRMKSQKALLAITRKMLVIIFNALKTGTGDL